MSRKVLCYGDSNTYGYDPRSFLGSRYPETIRWTALLQEQGWIVLNEGENGRSIPQREWAADAAVQVIERSKPDIVTVMLGSNDLLQDPKLSAEGCALRMERFIQTLLRQNWDCKFLLISPPPMTLGAWGGDETIVETSRQLAACYSASAQRMGIAFADAGVWNISLAFDGVHFSEAGHFAFADRIDQALTALLSEQEDKQ